MRPQALVGIVIGAMVVAGAGFWILRARDERPTLGELTEMAQERADTEERLAREKHAFTEQNVDHVAKVYADVSTLKIAIQLFEADCGHPPHRREGLDALRSKPEDEPNWNGPYLHHPIPLDPWGNPYQYATPGKNGRTGYLIISYGADGRPGGIGEDADLIDGE